MNFRKIATLATAATVAAGMTVLGLGITPAFAANGVEPVTFSVAAGSLALDQTPSAGTALVQGTAVGMPVTTVTDGRNDTARSGAWAVTAIASNLVAGSATILAAQITLAQSGTWTGTGTASGATGSFTASADSIDSVYTYTPTATLAAQSHINSGSYTGTVTQTVV